MRVARRGSGSEPEVIDPASRRRFLKSSGALALAAGLPGCGDASRPPDGGNGGGGGDGGVTVRQAQVKPQAKVLPAGGSLTIPEVTDTTVTLAGDVPALVPGDVIVSGEGLGLLRRVTGTARQNGATVLTTEDAALVDVFARLDAEIAYRLRPGDWAELQVGDDTVTATPATRQSGSGSVDVVSVNAQFANTGLSAMPTPGATLAVLLDGTIGAGLDIDYSFDLDDDGVRAFSFVPKLWGNSDMSLTARIKASVSTPKLTYLVMVGAPLTFALGAVPIVIFPTLFLSAYLTGAMETGFKWVSDYQADVSAGLAYTRAGGFSPVADANSSGSFLPERQYYATFTAEAVMCEARLTTAVYALGGPSVTLKLLSLRSQLAVNATTQQIKFNAAVTAGAQVGAAFVWMAPGIPEVNIEVASGSVPFFERVWEPGHSAVTIS